ncbi:MAG: FtsQ-type POTRA domain-containing protein [Clostridia bacterium]|nr:FtsQ-type POTRA domain-containing protein [Clostridia bacterium]
MLKSKKSLIIVVSILGVLALLLIAGSALFSLRSVTIDYLAYGDEISKYNKEEIVRVASFPIGKNILFLKYDQNIEKIEENFPYAKVTGVKRNFPDKLIVYIEQRVPAFRINYEGSNWAIIDTELKVLRTVSESELTTSEQSLAIWNNFGVTNVSLGKKIEKQTEKDITFSLYRGVIDDDVELNLNIIKTIDYEANEGETPLITLVLDDGVTMKIFGLNNLSEKAVGGFNHYQNYVQGSDNANTRIITVPENFTLESGSGITS